MDFGIVAGDTDQTIYVRLRDSTTGLAKTGLAYNSAGAVASYTLPGAARAAITLATQTANGAHSDGGFVEVDATNCKGLYRLDLPDAAIASGKYSIISIEFDGIIEESMIVPLSLRKADVRQNAGSNITSSSGRQEVNTTHIAGTSQTAKDLGAINVTNLNTLSGHDPGATLGTSTLTQTQVTGGAYALNSSSFAFNSAMDLTTTQKASVNSEADTALGDYDGPTYTELLNMVRLILRKDSAIATDLSSLLTAINADLASGGGAFANTTDSQEALRDRGDAAWITATSVAISTAGMQALIELMFTYDATATYGTADAGSLVAQIADNAGGSALTEAGIADAVWEELIAGHSGTSGSTAEALASASSAGDPWNTALPGAYASGKAGYIIGTYLDAAITSRLASASYSAPPSAASIRSEIDSNSTQLAAILADTNELQTDWANGGRLDLLIDAIKAKTDTLPTFPSNFAALGINASGHISRVTLVDTTTTNTDMLTAAAVNAEVDTALSDWGKTGFALTSSYDFAKGTTAMTESYNTDGAAPTPAQALMLIMQALTEVSISGTTMTIKKLDGSTTAATLTLDDASTPTSKTRAT